MMCDHKIFIAKVNVHRLTEEESSDKVGYSADIFINCEDCGLPFEFIGVEGGLSPKFPTVNFNSTELRCPIRPSKEKVDELLKKAKQN